MSTKPNTSYEAYLCMNYNYNMSESYLKDEAEDNILAEKMSHRYKKDNKSHRECTGSDTDYDNYIHDKVRHRRRRLNTIRYKKKLKRQSISIQGYPGIAYPVDKYGKYAEDAADIAYYKKICKSKNADRYRYHKKASNNAVHNHVDFVANDLDDNRTLFVVDAAGIDEQDIDEYDTKWNTISMIDEDLRYTLGRNKGAYKRVYEYTWAVD